MIRFKTESGSVYEVDTELRMYRSPRHDWRFYTQMGDLTLGASVVILDSANQTWTRTSPVVDIERIEKRMIEIEIVTGEDN